MFARLAARHERAFLTGFLVVVVGGLAWATVDSAADAGLTWSPVAAWAAAAAVTTSLMVARPRSGRLVLRRAEDRRRQREAAPDRWWLGLVVPGGFVLAAVGLLEVAIVYAALGGAISAMAPVLLWIAFVVRPDEHPDGDL